MARGRMISKSLGSSRKFHKVLECAGTLGEFTQALYPLIVVNADDFGRLSGDAFSVKFSVLPTSPRPEVDFDKAIQFLVTTGLIERYSVDGNLYIQVVAFDEHQVGLHKRTKSRFPDPCPTAASSRKLPEVPSELKRTEQKGTEENVTEGALRVRASGKQKGRLYVHRWQQEALIAILGPHTATFDLDVWLDALSAKTQHLALPPDPWKWVQSELHAEIKRRGLRVAAASDIVKGCTHQPPCRDEAAHTKRDMSERMAV